MTLVTALQVRELARHMDRPFGAPRPGERTSSALDLVVWAAQRSAWAVGQLAYVILFLQMLAHAYGAVLAAQHAGELVHSGVPVAVSVAIAVAIKPRCEHLYSTLAGAMPGAMSMSRMKADLRRFVQQQRQHAKDGGSR